MQTGGEGAVTQNPRSRANLKRGGIKGNAETAARARLAKEALRSSDEELLLAVSEDPESAVLEVHAQLTLGVRRLVRAWVSKGGNPDRVLIEALREFRQASRDATEYLRARGSTVETERFLGELDVRIASALELMPEGPKPVVEPPIP